MKKLILLLTLTILALSSCGKIEASADKKMQRKTEMAMSEAVKQIGYPAIVNFQEKKTMKAILELRDSEDLICYAYLFNRNTGKVGQFLGKSIGYGLPYSTQFSNPEKRTYQSGYGYHSMPQAEPNGLFMPEGLSATWLLLIDPKTGKARPVYVEPEIIVSPFPLH
jgi:hypothetical protein